MNLAADRFEKAKTSGVLPTGGGLPEQMTVNGDDIPKLKNELFPLYRRMIEIFQQNVPIADPDSQLYFSDLVRCAQSWERGLHDAVSAHQWIVVGQSKDHLKPFYRHLEKRRDTLLESYRPKESLGWVWCTRRSENQVKQAISSPISKSAGRKNF